LRAQGLEREPERHFGAGQVRQFNTEQLHAVIERREAERQAQHCRDERDSLIDVTTSLREVLAERDNAERNVTQDTAQGRSFDFEKEPEKLTSLISDALSEIQDDIDLQSLINESMAEFQGIHQEMVRQQEYRAEQQRQQEKERQRLAEQKRQKPDKGWSFS